MSILSATRKPYTAYYKDSITGEIKSIKRQPPKPQHSMLPTDTVELTTRKGEDWPANETYTIKHINFRQPNVIQLEDEQGKTTFVESSELKLIQKNSDEIGVKQIDSEIQGEYLVWP